jgi:hypothetical protein
MGNKKALSDDTALVLANLPSDLSSAATDAVNVRHRKLAGKMKSAAQEAFEIGVILTRMYNRLPPEVSWSSFVKARFIFTPQTANAYMRIAEKFTDNPALLEGETITAALEGLGKRETEPHGRIEYGNPNKQPLLPWEPFFQKPTLSNIPLRNHRFECPDGHELFLVRRGQNYPVKIIDIHAGDPVGELKYPYEEMIKNIQAAVELYYQEVEKQEDLT